jgi:hypothetical protein
MTDKSSLTIRRRKDLEQKVIITRGMIVYVVILVAIIAHVIVVYLVRNNPTGVDTLIQGTPYLISYFFAIKSQSKMDGKRSNKKD